MYEIDSEKKLKPDHPTVALIDGIPIQALITIKCTNIGIEKVPPLCSLIPRCCINNKPADVAMSPLLQVMRFRSVLRWRLWSALWRMPSKQRPSDVKIMGTTTLKVGRLKLGSWKIDHKISVVLLLLFFCELGSMSLLVITQQFIIPNLRPFCVRGAYSLTSLHESAGRPAAPPELSRRLELVNQATAICWRSLGLSSHAGQQFKLQGSRLVKSFFRMADASRYRLVCKCIPTLERTDFFNIRLVLAKASQIMGWLLRLDKVTYLLR